MSADFHTRLSSELGELRDKTCLRTLRNDTHDVTMIDLSSNDYLGLMHHRQLQEHFLSEYRIEEVRLSSVSSRLLSGNFPIFDRLERFLAQLYERESALFFNSGYHMNAGILPALTTRQSVILADKLVHASIIDGIRLSSARSIRYRHQDYDQLERLIATYHTQADNIFIVTESIFSMDGDITDLPRLVELKRRYPKVLLYVDEAHAVGVRGSIGRGVADESGCIPDIDFLCGTCGKALAAEGGFLVCNRIVRDYLINRCRTFIFTTAISPFQIDWLYFVWQHIPYMTTERAMLTRLRQQLLEGLSAKGYSVITGSHICPIVMGDNHRTMAQMEALDKAGIRVQAIRPPTVPQGTSRLRLSLHARLNETDIQYFTDRIPYAAELTM